MTLNNSRLLRALTSVLVAGGLMAVIAPVQATNQYLKDWLGWYTSSSTGDASCATCHGTSTSNLNAYGKGLCDVFLLTGVPADVTSTLISIEGGDSDGQGSSNREEIGANAQPGWTIGGNQIYATTKGGCVAVGAPVLTPDNVPLPYDPPLNGAPVADAGGPYTGNVGVPVTFDGSDSYDSDGGSIASYAWNFGDGWVGSDAVVDHTYVEAGTYAVTLTVVDDEGVVSEINSTTVTVSAAGVLDLDVAGLTVSKSVRVGKPISIQLSVNNPGPVLGQAIATVVGKVGTTQVYAWSLNVYDGIGGGTTTFVFPSYTPSAKGTIAWSVTIDDADPDVDTATATTVVK